MVIDHVGLFFFPTYTILRIIGRGAFPLFAWLIANGAHHTRDIQNYTFRLFLLSIISQIPFSLVNVRNGAPLWFFNVLFVFVFALLAIMVIRTNASSIYKFSAVAGAALGAFFLNADYGIAGVLTVVMCYVYFKQPLRLGIALSIVLGVLPTLFDHLPILSALSDSGVYLNNTWEAAGLLVLPFIYFYTGKRGPAFQHAFYAFYPLQYVCLYIAQIVLQM